MAKGGGLHHRRGGPAAGFLRRRARWSRWWGMGISSLRPRLLIRWRLPRLDVWSWVDLPRAFEGSSTAVETQLERQDCQCYQPRTSTDATYFSLPCAPRISRQRRVRRPLLAATEAIFPVQPRFQAPCLPAPTSEHSSASPCRIRIRPSRVVVGRPVGRRLSGGRPLRSRSLRRTKVSRESLGALSRRHSQTPEAFSS